MDPNLELRKLPHHFKDELARILDAAESWKKLMSIIPKSLEKSNFRCDINRHNPPKYTTQNFKLVEKVSSQKKKSCTLLLLRDWETSGKVLATLGHLLYLLTKAELFAAADYVAVDLLKQPPPERPTKGPGAKIVNIKPEEQNKKANDDIEKILDKINYPNFVINNILKNCNNQNKNIVKPSTPPAIVISESPDEEKNVDMFIPLVIQNEQNSRNSNNNTTNENNNNPTLPIGGDISEGIPRISALIKDSTTEDNLPRFSGLINESTSGPNNNSSENVSMSQNIPHLSALMEQTESLSDSQYIPRLSALSQDTNSNTSQNNTENSNETSSSEVSRTDSSNIPRLSILDNSQPSNTSSDMIPNISALNSTSQSCESSDACQIPRFSELSLNTSIPHFTYDELSKATDNFSTTPSKNGGRFLGSGAFGSVFLAPGLLERPLAVKRLHLQGGKEHMVTKQFKDEVEILSRYNHENLVSLLGYSCDGSTYCLCYEYLAGGALSERLQAKENQLPWLERINIAAGTAKGISYLHTAYSKPLIHRDIKSANILLDCNNKPKVCDFGLVKLAPDQNTSMTTTVIGTSAYMSPEAFRGDISVKLDTFSFGVVLLELLTSLPPVDDNREGRDIFTLGRGLACNYVIKCEKASREHCKLEFDGTNWYLQDTSTNGTTVNKHLLKGTKSGPLEDGDEIVIVPPNFTYTFQLPLSEAEVSDEQLIEIADHLMNMIDNETSGNKSGSSVSVQGCAPMAGAKGHSATATHVSEEHCYIDESHAPKKRKIEGKGKENNTGVPSENANNDLVTGSHNEDVNNFIVIDATADNEEMVCDNVGANVCIGNEIDTIEADPKVESPKETQTESKEKTEPKKEIEVKDNKAAAPSTSSAADSMNIIENEMQCIICTELFLKAVTLNCSHSFCKYCITEWQKTRSVCPICRANIMTVSPTIVLDNFIEKILDNAPEDVKQHRKEVIAERERLAAPEPKTKLKVLPNNRIIEISSEEGTDDDDDDEYDGENYDYSDYAVFNYDDDYSDAEEYNGLDDYSDAEEYNGLDVYSDVEDYNGVPGAYYGGYGSCYSCGQRGHWANGCPLRPARSRRR